MSRAEQSNSGRLGLSSKARRTGEQPISFLVAAALGNPDLINLAAGLVDPETLPVDASAELARRIFADPVRARAALQYDTTHGLAALRQATLSHIERLEGKPAASMGLTAADVLLTTGSQQALYLIGDSLIDPGDIVIAANPCYFVYTAALASFGAKVMTVPMDEQGMDVPGVEKLLHHIEAAGQLDRVKLVYVTSYYQNPTGLTLAAERRPRLLELAQRFSRANRILVLEDAAYRELRYDGPALPSIKSYDSTNRLTILTQTFSKPFAPGLKTGYTLMPADLMEAVVRQKGNHDFGSASLAQHLALEAMNTGAYAKQVEVLRDSYRRKRDAMLAALDRFMPKSPGVSWTRPDGGLYVWLTLPESIDTSRGGEMFRRCVEHGVIYVPGDYCFQPDVAGAIPRHHLRLSFGQVAPEKIEPGIHRLADIVSELLQSDRKSEIGNEKSSSPSAPEAAA